MTWGYCFGCYMEKTRVVVIIIIFSFVFLFEMSHEDDIYVYM